MARTTKIYPIREEDRHIVKTIKECKQDEVKCFLVDCKLSPFSYSDMPKDNWIPGVFIYKRNYCQALNLTDGEICQADEVKRINFSVAKGNKLYNYVRAPCSTDQTSKLWKQNVVEYLDKILDADFTVEGLEQIVIQLCSINFSSRLTPIKVLLFCSQHRKFSAILVDKLLTTFPLLLQPYGKIDFLNKTYEEIFALMNFDDFDEFCELCNYPYMDDKFFNKCFFACMDIVEKSDQGINFSCLQKLFSMGFVCPAEYPHELLNSQSLQNQQGMNAPNHKNFFEIVTYLLENGAKPIYRLTKEFVPPPMDIDKNCHIHRMEKMSFQNYKEFHEKHCNFASWMLVTQQCEERRECKMEILLELDIYFPATLVEIITAFLPWWLVVEFSPQQKRLLKILMRTCV